MKKHLTLIGIFLATAGLCAAGYRNVAPEEGPQVRGTRQRAEAAAAWTGVIEREDGRHIELRNLGTRFGSANLARGEQASILLTIPEAPEGTVVSVEATHGGRIGDATRAQLAVDADGTVEIPFRMGTMGGHPVHVRVQDRVMGLSFMVEEPLPQLSGTGAEKEVLP